MAYLGELNCLGGRFIDVSRVLRAMNETQTLAGPEAETAAEDDARRRDSRALDRESDSPPALDLSKDEIFGVLKNQRRRQTLQYLRRQGGAAERGDIAVYIAAEENDITVEEVSCSQRKRVYISLHQCHLPKMADVDAVTYDQTSGTVELESAARLLFPYLELDPRSPSESIADLSDVDGADADRTSAGGSDADAANEDRENARPRSAVDEDPSTTERPSDDGRVSSQADSAPTGVRRFARLIARRF